MVRTPYFPGATWWQAVNVFWARVGRYGTSFLIALIVLLVGSAIYVAFEETVVVVNYNGTASVSIRHGVRVLSAEYRDVERSRQCPSKVEYTLRRIDHDAPRRPGEPPSYIVRYITDSSNGPPIPPETRNFKLEFDLSKAIEGRNDWEYVSRSADTCTLLMPIPFTHRYFQLPFEHTNIRQSEPIQLPIPELPS